MYLQSPAKSAPPAASKMPKVEIEIRSIDRMHLHLYMNIARLKEQLVQQGAQTTVERLTTELPRLGEPVILTEQVRGKQSSSRTFFPSTHSRALALSHPSNHRKRQRPRGKSSREP